MPRSIACAALLFAATAFGQATAPSYDIATFQRDYPPAAAKLAEAYRHVRIVGTSVMYYSQSTGAEESMRESQDEVLYSGGAVRRVDVNTKSTDTRWPPGSTTIDIGTADHLISCFRVGTDGEWQVSSTPKRREFSIERMTVGPAFAPYCLDYSTIEELLKIGNRHIVSVAGTSMDGQDAIEMITDLYYEVKKEKHLMREHFFFQPRSWALLGRTLERGPLTLRSKITYDPAGPDGIPRLRSTERYEGHAATPGNKEGYARFEVTTLEFVATPAEQFQPAALVQLGAKDIADMYAPEAESAASDSVPPSTLPLAASVAIESPPVGHAFLWIATISIIFLAGASALVFTLRSRRHGR